MGKERIQFTKSCTDLLEFSAGDLVPMLEKKPKLLHVKQCAFDYYSPKTKETYQVQVTVTRRESDFLEPFQTEEMAGFQPETRNSKPETPNA